jgi:hypothetical protein
MFADMLLSPTCVETDLTEGGSRCLRTDLTYGLEVTGFAMQLMRDHEVLEMFEVRATIKQRTDVLG